MPVATNTKKAGQAMRAKARASTLGASPPRERAGPTRTVITIWPPTQTAAARTWRVRRTVSSAGARPLPLAMIMSRAPASLALPLGRPLLGEGGRALHGVGRREHDGHRLGVDGPAVGLGHLRRAL